MIQGADKHTIFALATPPGRSGIAVIRISGPAVPVILSRMIRGPMPAPRHAVLRSILDPISHSMIDRALVLRFEPPASFTGEAVVEFHLHGGRAVVEAAIAALSTIEGCRPAQAGEFTRRAFDNDKLDLTEIEGLADLIDAQTHAQHRQAMRHYRGDFGKLVGQWRDQLLRALAYAEADLDFPDEALPQDMIDQVAAMVRPARDTMGEHLASFRQGERLREGYRVVIVGAPNVGKSSLFNRLVQRSAAIVSDRPGTTRDILHADLDIGGYPVVLCDTAGLRQGADEIESEGIRRAQAEAQSADLLLWVAEPGKGFSQAQVWAAPVIRIVNKSDLGGDAAGDLTLSAQTGDGVNALLTKIAKIIAETMAPPESACLTRQRHRMALEEVVTDLDRAQRAHAPELLAEDLRLAVRALGRITGKVDVEDVLDVIFRDFCIGK